MQDLKEHLLERRKIYMRVCELANHPTGLRCCNSLPPPTSLVFPSMDVVCCKCRCGGDLCFYIGGSLPSPCQAVSLLAAPPSGVRGLHAIALKF